MTDDAQARAADERRRLIDAFTKLAAETGYENASGAEVTAHAGLPVDSFYEHFPSELVCLVAAHDAFYQRIMDSVLDAIGTEEEWPTMVRKGVEACLECIAESERHSRLFAVEAVRAGPIILERRFAHTSHIAGWLRQGRRHFPEAEPIAKNTEWALVAGALAWITSHLLAEQGPQLPRVAAELTEFLLVPYLGAAGAARALVRTGPDVDQR